jgi:hypothetical protein
MQIIALINQKVSVGKTNLAINIGAGINGFGKMCVVDRFRSVSIFLPIAQASLLTSLKIQ